LISEFFGVWMLLGSVVWKMLCLFWCLDGNVKVSEKVDHKVDRKIILK